MTQIDAVAEQWRAVPGWPYEASNLGRIRRIPRTGPPQLTAQWTRGQKYPMTCLFRPVPGTRTTQRWQVAAHRVIAEAWLGPKPGVGYEVDHIDGNRHNNLLDNLRWVTPSENIRGAVERGHRGENRWNAKLTEADVREILQMKDNGLRPAKIAFLLGIDLTLVSHVYAGRNWKHIRPEVTPEPDLELVS